MHKNHSKKNPNHYYIKNMARNTLRALLLNKITSCILYRL